MMQSIANKVQEEAMRRLTLPRGMVYTMEDDFRIVEIQERTVK